MAEYTLYQGDCLEILPTLEVGSVDAVITDPPYGTTACSWDNVIPFDPMWDCIRHVRKERAAVVLFGSEPFSSMLRVSNLKEYKYDWVWDKKRGYEPQLANIRPQKSHEIISLFYLHNYHPQKTKIKTPDKRNGNGEKLNKKNGRGLNIMASVYNGGVYRDRYPLSVIKFGNENQAQKHHPSQKPVPLLEYLIKTYTLPGQNVLDFTMGSGTTGVACMRTGRNFIGIELDPDYFKIAETRIKNANNEFVRTEKERERGQLALFGD